ncbi:dnaJ homolog subfamily B member 14-like [Dendronephthya gigantea]|uniref:dnaJ homolog subfamily B member 14-like n=1 Tax=Dendronephthya gigantea TaxID=151771 RepID=UPI00106B1257|nr:dnaJ homolog subfamily B member 14-like [Dendronephthya gigantea]
MEGNKDEAKKCLEFARRYLAKGEKEKAKKFLNKSQRLFPLKEAESFAQELNKKDSKENGDENIHNGSAHKTDKNNEKNKNNFEECDTEEKTKECDYTPDQLAEVKRINKLKDYYEILGVEKDAKDADLRKAYKKLALQFHPDKNRAPGSTEAFKAIGNSFAILSNPEKRKKYDLYGPDSPALNHNHSHNHFNHNDFEADITPEDLFNMFFGGMAGNQVFVHRRHPRRRQRRRHSEEEEYETHEGGLGRVMHLIPILIFLGISVLTSLMVQDPPYSFNISGPYRLHRITPKYKVSYYVQSDFNENYSGKTLTRLENQIEREYLGRLRSTCFREQQIREDMYARARFWNDQSLLRRANNMKTESCDELERMRNR